MRISRVSLLVVLLVAGLLAALPGIAEGIERMAPGDDCDEGCGTSCDQCVCCARTMSAVLLPYLDPGTPGRCEIASPALSTRVPSILSEGVYHPPRA